MQDAKLILNELVRERQKFLSESMAGNGLSLDTKRDLLWEEFGYPRTITDRMCRIAYERHPPAHAIVNRIHSKTWQHKPQIVESIEVSNKQSTKWEIDVNKIFSKALPAFMDADHKNIINKFSGLLIRYRDGLPLDQPVDAAEIARQGIAGVAGFVSIWGESLRANKVDDDLQSDSFGKVILWDVNQSRSETEQPIAATVHHSRIIIFAEGSIDNNHLNGRSIIEVGYNCLIDMQKARGGCAEGIAKNASRPIHINFDGAELDIDQLLASMGASSAADLNRMLNEDIRKLHTHIDAAIVTSGASVTPLSAPVPDPMNVWQVAANEVVSSAQLPFTIVFGQQTGRLASDQDQKDYAVLGAARQEKFIDYKIHALIDNLAAARAIEKKDNFFVQWKTLLDVSESDKAAVLERYTNAMDKFSLVSGGKMLYSGNELRQKIGDEVIAGLEDITPEKQDENQEINPA